jgi:hypothetical protein
MSASKQARGICIWVGHMCAKRMYCVGKRTGFVYVLFLQAFAGYLSDPKAKDFGSMSVSVSLPRKLTLV